MRKKNIMMLSILIIVLLLLVACSQQSAQNNAQEDEQKSILNEEQAYDLLTTYLYENFGGAGNPDYATSWYTSIKSIRLELDSDGQADVSVSTDLMAGKKDKIAEDIAKSIATAIVGNSDIDVKSVTVHGQNGIVGSWSYFK